MNGKCERIISPEYSDWQCELFGTGPNGMVMRVEKGREPNWFWRWMQYLCFGNKWVRKPEAKTNE